jgi:hypothetical protein
MKTSRENKSGANMIIILYGILMVVQNSDWLSRPPSDDDLT